MHTIQKYSKYFDSLTGIRALAAFLVFFHHSSPFNPGTFGYKITYEFHIGVTIFFVLSGFLITYRYFDNFIISWGWIKVYLGNRLARILPIYSILSILTLAIFYHDNFSRKAILELILSVTLLKGFFNDLKFIGIAQGWSLTVEECFYLSAPFIFLLLKAKRYFLFILPIILILIGCLLTLVFSKVNIYGFFENYTFLLLYTFFGRCVEFFVGIQLALLIRKKHFYKVFKFPFYTYTGLLGILSIVFFLSLLQRGIFYGLYNPAGIFLNNLILPFFVAMLFYGLIREMSFFKQVMESKLFILFGKSSYVFYLIHTGVIEDFIKTYLSSNVFILFILLNFISLILFYTIENPIHKRLHKGIASDSRKSN